MTKSAAFYVQTDEGFVLVKPVTAKKQYPDAGLTPFGTWLNGMLPRVEIDCFDRYIWSAPGVLKRKRWFPVIRLRLWKCRPHSSADRTKVKILVQVTL